MEPMYLSQHIRQELHRKKKADAEAARRRADDEATQERLWQTEAVNVLAALKVGISNAIADGQTSVEVMNVADVCRPLEAKGAAGIVVDHLTDVEGLGDRLWVDIDCSGNLRTYNRLMLKLDGPVERDSRP